MSSVIELNRDISGIAIVTLNRPEAANALSLEMLNELDDVLSQLRYDHSLRCVILTGAGEKAFCAGADLKERVSMNEPEVKKAVRLIGHTISAVEGLPQPVIAAINGSAFGGGLELALACDIRIAAETAKMGLTETSLGIIPGAGGTQRLPRLIGIAKAKELIFTARRIDAFEAERLGLISKTSERNQLLTEAISLANEIARNAPIALQAAKEAINQGVETDLATGLKMEELCYGMTIHTNDRLEGLNAFKEKRKPIFAGK
ncbi:enoyl-CoA hydratase [Peribacillus cavernae]|uniref:Enoyl-CoA hydratase n=1 Tax=Peribacillus cavernae TaxID=1674310 RepID=A0A3S0TZF2_9BACI|nr:enoyl-CoA hydratase [Peribacillus cavernae]MDQ0220465.1 enoyl-CoA hydratase/carnithine racemase [Peribacillus cavernae]RUQ28032.1 enoyl-CoA hydratase [Peribacillus cavernae]